MAFQLTQLVPPYHPSLGIPALPNPSNPPTAQDVCDGVEYSHQVLSIYLNKKGILPPQVVADTKRYEVGLITSYDIGQQPALPPAPAGTGPAAANANAPVIPLDGQAVAAALLNSYTQIMATLAQIQADLTDIQRTQSDMQTIQANLQTELTGVQTTQADLQTSQANIQADLNTVRTIQATMRGDLNVVRTLQANMQTTQTGMQTTLTDVRTSQGDMERALANVQATLAVHGATLAEHGTKLGSLTRVCAQVLFLPLPINPQYHSFMIFLESESSPWTWN
ncbi:hypothetical protein CPB85DRAFT_1301430 [Mucidula mucida]|nr:hypothetical protein CPB85DRAFT_1301430 [Mucidula mucida]